MVLFCYWKTIINALHKYDKPQLVTAVKGDHLQMLEAMFSGGISVLSFIKSLVNQGILEHFILMSWLIFTD